MYLHGFHLLLFPSVKKFYACKLFVFGVYMIITKKSCSVATQTLPVAKLFDAFVCITAVIRASMHNPSAAKSVQAASQCIYDRRLTQACEVRYAALGARLLKKPGLSPLQECWWQQTSEFN